MKIVSIFQDATARVKLYCADLRRLFILASDKKYKQKHRMRRNAINNDQLLESQKVKFAAS